MQDRQEGNNSKGFCLLVQHKIQVKKIKTDIRILSHRNMHNDIKYIKQLFQHKLPINFLNTTIC